MRRLTKARWGLFVLALLLPVMAWAQYGQYGFNPLMMGFNEPWYMHRFAQHALSALWGGLAGAFFSEKLREFRRWLIIGGFVLGALVGVIVSTFLGNITFFVLAAGGAWYLLREEAKAAQRKKKAKPTTFGSAEWATLEHLTEHGLVGTKGFALGAYQNDGTSSPLHYTGDRHLLTVAPTRSGKGVAAIIPNLLTYEGSIIVIDPKGENARITAERRGRGNKEKAIPGLGQTVHVVDPWGITGQPVSRFNPMDWLDPKDEDISENAMMLADSIVTPSHGHRDQFWDEEAKALLMGLLLYVALDEREKQDRNLGRVRDIICLGEDSLKDIMLQMMENPNPIVSSTAERTLAKEAKLRSNVLASLQAHTHFLDSPRIRSSLEVSDFRFEDLKTSRMTVYLVLPADRLDAFGRWLRLLVQQAITVNARNVETKPDKPILFLLDEMASLGRLTMVEQAFGLMAGFGMQLWGVVQDLSQLERIYEKGWETFIGNSGVLQYFGSRDHKTAEYFSKLCGVTTVTKFSFTQAVAKALGWSSSSTSGGRGGSSTSGTSSSTTWSDGSTEDIVQRHLVFPDELMVLRDNKQLLMIENCNPIPGKKILWYQDKTLKSLGADLAQEPETQPEKDFKDNVFASSWEPPAEPKPEPPKLTRQEALEKIEKALIDQGGKIVRNNKKGKIRVIFRGKEEVYYGQAQFEEWLLRAGGWKE